MYITASVLEENIYLSDLNRSDLWFETMFLFLDASFTLWSKILQIGWNIHIHHSSGTADALSPLASRCFHRQSSSAAESASLKRSLNHWLTHQQTLNPTLTTLTYITQVTHDVPFHCEF